MGWFSNRLIEIPVLILFFDMRLTGPITQNFILYRTCYVSLGYNESDCALLGTDNEDKRIKQLEKDVQPLASSILMVQTILLAILPVVFCFILGPWSSKHGRKPILISCMIGMFFTYIIGMGITLIPSASPWWWLTTVLATSIGGGECTMLTVAFSYIAESTTKVNRGMKMAILELCTGFGSVLGMLSSSYIFIKIGYGGLFAVSSGAALFAAIYIYFFLAESVQIIEKENKLRDLFSFSNIIDPIKSTFKQQSQENSGRSRILLWLFLSIIVIDVFVFDGDDSVFFLFVREKFNWSLSNYTLFSGINASIDILTTTFILGVLYKRLKIKDSIIIISSFALMCISSLVIAFVNTDLGIYAGYSLKSVNIPLLPLSRSAISQLVPSENLGSVFAFSTSAEMLSEAISAPIYTLVYNATLKQCVSAFNFVSAAILVLGILVTSVVIYLQRKEEQEIQTMNEGNIGSDEILIGDNN